ncbi:hypothetical protein V6N13_147513 [Hibiscus sabdariffa]
MSTTLISNPRLLVPPHFLFQFSISGRVLFVCSPGAVDVPSRGTTSVTTSGLILTIRNRWSWVVYKVGLSFRPALFSKEIRWGGLSPCQVFSSVLMVKGWKPDSLDAQAILSLQICRCKRPLFISRDGWYDPIFQPLKALDGDARQSRMDFDNSFPLVPLHGFSFCLGFKLSRNKILISVGVVEMAVKDIVPSILTWKINFEVKKPWKIDGIAGFAVRPHGRRRCHDTKVEGEDFCDISLSKGQKPRSFSKHGLQVQIHCWNLLGFFSHGDGAGKSNVFTVVGHVYCDTCRVEFETKLSEPISGATVKLECNNRTDDTSTYQSPEITTGAKGEFRIHVTGDYEDSDCDVILMKSPREDCNEPTESWRKARVVITTKDGVTGNIRYANNLGFKRKEALPECKQVLTEMGYYELKNELGKEAAP